MSEEEVDKKPSCKNCKEELKTSQAGKGAEDIFEGMCWPCFHYEFEHGDMSVGDWNAPCQDPACPLLKADEYNEKLIQVRENLTEIEIHRRQFINRKHVGACFKTKNSTSKDGYWWLYFRIVDITEEGTLTCIQFQETDSDQLELSKNSYRYWLHDEELVRITVAEFNMAAQAFLRAVSQRLTTSLTT